MPEQYSEYTPKKVGNGGLQCADGTQGVGLLGDGRRGNREKWGEMEGMGEDVLFLENRVEKCICNTMPNTLNQIPMPQLSKKVLSNLYHPCTLLCDCCRYLEVMMHLALTCPTVAPNLAIKEIAISRVPQVGRTDVTTLTLQ